MLSTIPPRVVSTSGYSARTVTRYGFRCYLWWIVAGRTPLAVHAHPGDETIGTGGILARYSAAGVRTVVVTCATGDLGEVSDPGLLGTTGVSGLRQLELEAAGGILGVSRLVSLGYGDSGMPGWPENKRPGAFFAAPLDDASERLLRIIDQER